MRERKIEGAREAKWLTTVQLINSVLYRHSFVMKNDCVSDVNRIKGPLLFIPLIRILISERW